MFILNVKDENFETKIEAVEREKAESRLSNLLREQEAYDKDSAIELQSLLEKANCGKEPLKKLAQEPDNKNRSKNSIKIAAGHAAEFIGTVRRNK